MEWKSIPGYEGFYSVSDTGLVRSETRQVRYKNDALHIHKGKILRQATSDDGYKSVTLQNGGKVHGRRVNRLVMLAFEGRSELQVNHKDKDKTNNKLGNLEYITARENHRHANMSRGASKYIGVSQDNSKTKWKANIFINGKSMYLGRFDTEDDAALAYNKAAVKFDKGGKYLNYVG